MLSGSRGAGRFSGAQAEFLERGREIPPGRNFLFRRQDDLLADTFRFILRQLHLVIEFRRGGQSSLEHITQSCGSSGKHQEQ